MPNVLRERIQLINESQLTDQLNEISESRRIQSAGRRSDRINARIAEIRRRIKEEKELIICEL